MADTAISVLPEASALDGTELYAVVQDGTTKRTTIGSLGTAAAADVTTSDSDDTSGRVLRIDDYLDRAGESDDAWTEVTSLDNGWTGGIQYILSAGWAKVIFDNLDGSDQTSVNCLTVPSAYRPDITQRGTLVALEGTDAPLYVDIDSNGEINITGDNNDNERIRGSITYPVL